VVHTSGAGQKVSPLPTPFLILLVFWLTILFASFGLFSSRNITVIIALVLCVVAVSSGIELVIDMTNPFGGIVRLSSTPLRHAVKVLSE
jgi:hypothetical protein